MTFAAMTRPAALAVAILATTWVALGPAATLPLRIKSDEATYAAMALSLAWDGDLTYEAHDITRFRSIYGSGPEGIFLKRGSEVQIAVQPRWPVISVEHEPDKAARLYFGKPLVYPVLAAPVVRVLGPRGLVWVNVLLLFVTLWAGAAFLARQTTAGLAWLTSGAFLFGSITPLYVFWLTPEILNYALVSVAFALAFRPGARSTATAVTPATAVRTSVDLGAMLVAAVLLGLATYSKPTNVLLIAPLGIWTLFKAGWKKAVLIGAVFGLVVVAAFALTAASSGEANYQGGDRKTFYRRFPFESQDATFEALGIVGKTDTVDTDASPDNVWRRAVINTGYFVVGRHFGLLPYFFPAMLFVIAALVGWRRLLLWQIVTILAAAATIPVFVLWLPYTWSGGGGPLGNRYFLSIVASLFFVVPRIRAAVLPLVALAGGLVFLGPALMHPIRNVHEPWRVARAMPLRLLPIELTAAGDLPVMLDSSIGRVGHGAEPLLYLSFLDANATVHGGGRVGVVGGTLAEILVKTDEPLSALRIDARSLGVAGDAALSSTGTSHRLPLAADERTVVTLPVEGVFSRDSYVYLLKIDLRHFGTTDPERPMAAAFDALLWGVRAGR